MVSGHYFSRFYGDQHTLDMGSDLKIKWIIRQSGMILKKLNLKHFYECMKEMISFFMRDIFVLNFLKVFKMRNHKRRRKTSYKWNSFKLRGYSLSNWDIVKRIVIGQAEGDSCLTSIFQFFNSETHLPHFLPYLPRSTLH